MRNCGFYFSAGPHSHFFFQNNIPNIKPKCSGNLSFQRIKLAKSNNYFWITSNKQEFFLKFSREISLISIFSPLVIEICAERPYWVSVFTRPYLFMRSIWGRSGKWGFTLNAGIAAMHPSWKLLRPLLPLIWAFSPSKICTHNIRISNLAHAIPSQFTSTQYHIGILCVCNTHCKKRVGNISGWALNSNIHSNQQMNCFYSARNVMNVFSRTTYVAPYKTTLSQRQCPFPNLFSSILTKVILWGIACRVESE